MTGRRPSARELIGLLVDPGGFRSWDQRIDDSHAGNAYRADLDRARTRSGVDESVLTGVGTIGGRRVALIVSEFSFLGGSIGVAAAERVVRALERATLERLPVLACPASGGTRMQEGAVAFLSMVKISAAVGRHKSEGLPYLVYLRNPTTGGVMASWGALGNITLAEPGALIGFLGPRVYEALHGEAFPEGVQTAENLQRHGIVDATVAPEELVDVVARILALLDARSAVALSAEHEREDNPSGGDPWTSVVASRRPDRPDIHALLAHGATSVVPLTGTGEGECGSGAVLTLVRFGSVAVVLVGQDRNYPAFGPAALRTARRGMRLAQELRLPLVTVVDTPGAALSREAEEGGLAGEIARSIADLVMLPQPTTSVILGQGTGGAALAFLPADRTLVARHGWLSPLAPEGASAITHRSTSFAPELARVQRIGAPELLADGIADAIIPERPDAADEPVGFCRRVAAFLEHTVRDIALESSSARLAKRLARYRTLGLR